MSQSHSELKAKLEQFQFDEPSAEFSFSRRLARENRWTHSFARRVIEEYKRFVLLTQTAGHSVCPSEQVDQAWHLHLTYTKSYWGDLCSNVLGRPLHHVPTQGGPTEHAKHRAMYEQTLTTYRATFGHEPPSDIWPDTETRFGSDVDCRRVNIRDHWVIPKPHRWWRWSLAAFVNSGWLAVPAAGFIWNPLDWRGPEFLALYWISFLICVVFAFLSKRSDRNISWQNPRPMLHPYEIACLAQNPKAVVNSALVKLIQAGIVQHHVELDQPLGNINKDRFTVIASPPPDLNSVEKAIVETIQILRENTTHREILKSGIGPALKLQQSLIDEGLVVDTSNQRGAGVLPFLALMSLCVFGVLKIFVGLSRERPVAFLIVSCVVTVIAAGICLYSPRRRSVTADRLIKDYRQRSTALLIREKRSATIEPDKLALAVALFGATALIGSPLSAFHETIRRSESSNSLSTGCGSSGCSGSGCGGGGSGCSGGGGCGGCGGGGGD